MEEVFNVWYENNDQISELSGTAKTGENYKLARPTQIYHLDLQHSARKSEEEPVEEDVKAPSADTRKSILPPNLPMPSERAQLENLALVAPENIQWFYLDPSGNEQGPFTGDMMQEWLTDGYLTFDLRIRRSQESQFQPLKNLCEMVQNFILPFKVPLPDLSFDQDRVLQSPPSAAPASGNSASSNSLQSGQSFGGGNLYSQLMPNGSSGLGAASMRLSSSNHLFDFMGHDYPLMHQQNQFPPNQFGIDPVISQSRNVNLNINLNHGNLAHSNLNQNISGNIGGNIGSNISSGFGQLHMPSLLQQQIQQPNLSRTNSGWGLDGGLMAGNAQTPTSAPPLAPMAAQPGPISPWLTGMQSVSRVSSPFVPSSSLTGSTESANVVKAAADDQVLHDLHSSMVTGILGDDEAKEPEVEVPARHQLPVPVEEVADETVEEEQEPEEQYEHTEDSQPALAPWAKAAAPVAEPAKPSMTLKQIQELEAERLRKDKQLRAELKQEVSLANAIAASKIEDKTGDKVTFNWATASQPVVTKKSLAEIQKEEVEARSSVAVAKTTTTAPKSSFASSLATSVPKEDSAWTTVASKKTVPKRTTAPAAAVPLASANKLSPQMLRAASATSLNGSSINTHALKEDFLVWARSAMTNLYPSVSKNDLLEIFTTLPLHGADSGPLISETIYSSSATMDGRRFAQEFMKKRQQVEKQIGASDGESWSGAIFSSADKVLTVDDDGWSTSVKSKKKGKKN